MRCILLVILLTGCLSSQKVDRQLSRIEKKHPVKIAKFARQKYPCIIKKVDTTITYMDTTVVIDCDTVINVVDTIINEVTKERIIIKERKVKVPVRVEVPSVVKYIADSSNVLLCAEENKRLQAIIDKNKKDKEKFNIWFVISILLVTALLMSLLRKSKNENSTGKKAPNKKG